MREDLNIDLKRLQRAIDGSVWNTGDQVLYNLCKRYPLHSKDDEILAKIWLIGRSYSASIERRKTSLYKGDRFYEEVVGPKLKQSQIDNWLRRLIRFNRPSNTNCAEIISVHKNITALFQDIAGLEKRSLASKYLHFHMPHLFFIYDSIAAKQLAAVVEYAPKHHLRRLTNYDRTYAKFFLRCLWYVEAIEDRCGLRVTPRQLDNYLVKFRSDT